MTYLAITQAKVTTDYRDQAIENIKRVKSVALSNGAKLVRLALMQSGSNVGKLMFFQFFESLDDAERVYDAFTEDAIYRETMKSGKFEITRRGMLRVHMEFGDLSAADNLKYATLTVGTSDDPQLGAITKFANVLTANGAVTAVYGSGFVGDMADGKTHVFGATYPSLSAVQSAYDAAAKAGAADELYKVVSVQRRQVLRLLD
tara:strand:+ start:40 stop:648 length:609 start_codon:yes stop_codon:yes gene_type:complete